MLFAVYQDAIQHRLQRDHSAPNYLDVGLSWFKLILMFSTTLSGIPQQRCCNQIRKQKHYHKAVQRHWASVLVAKFHECFPVEFTIRRSQAYVFVSVCVSFGVWWWNLLTVTEMQLAILSVCTEEELLEDTPAGSERAQGNEEEEEEEDVQARRARIKRKILAVGKMQRVFQLLRSSSLFCGFQHHSICSFKGRKQRMHRSSVQIHLQLLDLQILHVHRNTMHLECRTIL